MNFTNVMDRLRSEEDTEEVSDDDSPVSFLIHENLHGVVPEPVPAREALPDWYDNLPMDLEDPQSTVTSTARKCSPLGDALRMGWILRLPQDLFVKTNGDLTEYKSNTDVQREALSEFNVRQVGGDDFPADSSLILKFDMEWAIKTDPGWSVLLTHPMNHVEMRWRSFSGVLDTDTDPIYANVPIVWLEPGYSGVIKAGTPIAHVIPFKRDGLASEARIGPMTKEEYTQAEKYVERQRVKTGAYWEENRQPKPNAKNVELERVTSEDEEDDKSE